MMKSINLFQLKSNRAASVAVLTVLALATVEDGARAAGRWEAIPIVGQEAIDAGYHGGEGCQWPRVIVVSPTDPNFVLFGTDVGGIYRSLDGGGNWQVCMVGWTARGSIAFAIDPRNPSHVLGVGGGSGDNADIHGVYLSQDKAASWKHVLKRAEGTIGSIAFDRSSAHADLKGCAVAYYDSSDGLYKSVDGGESWKKIGNLGKMTVRVHPTKGYVYLAGEAGFYRSVDGGLTFTQILTQPASGIDTSVRAPNNVFLSGRYPILISNDSGLTFKATLNEVIPANGQAKGAVVTKLPDGVVLKDIAVSPVDPRRMTVWYEAGNYNWVSLYSFDEGRRWKVSDMGNNVDGDYRKVHFNVMPYNVRNGIRAWSPVSNNLIYGVGGDWITLSRDGGGHFVWNGDGENAVMIGSSFNFNPSNSATVFLSFQDYNGAHTVDGGRTWAYHDVSGQGYGGFEYGGMAVDEHVMWSGDAPSWGGIRKLKVSTDGGATWAVKQSAGKDITFAGPDVSYVDPTDTRICFASNWRSADKGATWMPMSGCEGVFISNPSGKQELYGKHGGDVVQSLDHGVTWTTAALSLSSTFADVAYDPKHKRFWIVADDRLKMAENGTVVTVDIPKDQLGAVRASSVAVDPIDPDIVYVANHKDYYACDNAVVRSTDGGNTWTNLTVTNPLVDGVEPGGPHEVQWLRVNPKTRDLWAAGQCYGMWKWVEQK